MENERLRIIQNFESLKSGEINPVKRIEGVNFGLLSTKNIIGSNIPTPNLNDPEVREKYLNQIPGMRDKIRADEEKLKQLKEK